MTLTPEQEKTLAKLREEVFAEKIIQEGDTIGTGDETLLSYLSFIYLESR
jgi:hypothetical protein